MNGGAFNQQGIPKRILPCLIVTIDKDLTQKLVVKKLDVRVCHKIGITALLIELQTELPDITQLSTRLLSTFV